MSKGSNVVARVETITPQLAQKMLEKSRDFLNRPLARTTVDRYAEKMKAGEWHLNGESIVIGSDGVVTDGYHRLNAVIKADVPVDAVVVRGTDPDTYVSMDQGRARTLAHALYREGYANYSAVSAIARNYRAIELCRVTNLNSAKFDTSELKDLVDRIPQIHKWASMAKTFSKRFPVPSAIGAAALWIDLVCPDQEAVDSFFDGLIDGDGLMRSSPCWLLREKLLDTRGQHGGNRTRGAKPELVIYYTLRAWAAHRTGERLTRLAQPKLGITVDAIASVDPTLIEKYVGIGKRVNRWKMTA